LICRGSSGAAQAFHHVIESLIDERRAVDCLLQESTRHNVHVRLNESRVGDVIPQFQDISVWAAPTFDILVGPDRDDTATSDRDGISFGLIRVHGDDGTEEDQLCFRRRDRDLGQEVVKLRHSPAPGAGECRQFQTEGAAKIKRCHELSLREKPAISSSRRMILQSIKPGMTCSVARDQKREQRSRQMALRDSRMTREPSVCP
jgi:hypothetical protein